MNDDGLTRLAVPVGADDHVRGADGAPVTIVEYGDFECPFCVRAHPTVRRLEERYAGRLRFVFRSFPLRIHRHAETAAEAAEFAADRGAFWAMHDALYERDGGLTVPELRAIAERVGLDGGELAEALEVRTYAPVVAEVKEGGEESGIPGTPAFFLNEILFEDEPTEDALSEAIAWLLTHEAG